MLFKGAIVQYPQHPEDVWVFFLDVSSSAGEMLAWCLKAAGGKELVASRFSFWSAGLASFTLVNPDELVYACYFKIYCRTPGCIPI